MLASSSFLPRKMSNTQEATVTPSAAAVRDGRTMAAGTKASMSQEDCVNNNMENVAKDSAPLGSAESPSKLEMMHEHKDEYMEDPLPDLVGNLKITEEPEPDLTVLDQEFVLEDFEFHISTSDEDDGEMLDVDDDDDSDLEFFDATSVTGRSSGPGVTCDLDGSLMPETENVSVDFLDQQPLSINNSDDVVSSTGTAGTSKLASVKQTAKKVAAKVRNIVGRKRITIKSGQYVRVMYHNLEKPYVARVSPAYHFKNFLTLGEQRDDAGENLGDGEGEFIKKIIERHKIT